MSEVEEIHGVTIYRVAVESFLQRGIVDDFRSELLELIDRRNVKRLAIDFSGVTFVNSMALGAVVTIHKKLKDSGGELAVFGLNEIFERVLRTMRLHELFALCPDQDEAIAALLRE